MALDADSILLSAKHAIRRCQDLVIAMAGFTLGYSHFVESFFMRAFGEKLSGAGMALSANKGNGRDFWRRSSMISVAAVAGWSREVFFFEERVSMDTLFVILELAGRDFIGFHVVFIRMTAAACLRNIPGESRGFGMARSQNAMGFMAVCADSHLCVTFFQQLAVAARPV